MMFGFAHQLTEDQGEALQIDKALVLWDQDNTSNHNKHKTSVREHQHI